MASRQTSRTNPGRRRPLSRTQPLSLPWTDAARMIEACTACGACVEACPQDILTIVGGTRPEIRFDAPCLFCAACADACPEDVFDRGRTPPWEARAVIGGACLEAQGVSCRACEDVCEARALRFRPALGGRAEIEVAPDACTGCGACVPVCPVGAIAIRRGAAPEVQDAA